MADFLHAVLEGLRAGSAYRVSVGRRLTGLLLCEGRRSASCTVEKDIFGIRGLCNVQPRPGVWQEPCAEVLLVFRGVATGSAPRPNDGVGAHPQHGSHIGRCPCRAPSRGDVAVRGS